MVVHVKLEISTTNFN